MRAFFALLALCLTLTSVSSAVMHAEMQGSREMVICADAGGAGVVTIRLDATGKPIPGHHRCPECLASLATALLPADVALTPPLTAATLVHSETQARGTSRPTPQASARGPPLFT
jgi:hypothetical protein